MSRPLTKDNMSEDFLKNNVKMFSVAADFPRGYSDFKYSHAKVCPKISSVQFSLVQFSLVQLKAVSKRSKKAHMHSTPRRVLTPRGFPNFAFENSSNVGLIDNNGPVSSFKGRPSTAVFFYASHIQAIGGVICL